MDIQEHHDVMQEALGHVMSHGIWKGIHKTGVSPFDTDDDPRPVDHEDELIKSLQLIDDLAAGTHPSGVTLWELQLAATKGGLNGLARVGIALPEPNWLELQASFKPDDVKRTVIRHHTAIARARVLIANNQLHIRPPSICKLWS